LAAPGVSPDERSSEASSPFGGVLLDRLGGTAGLGMSLRVVMPCPVVQRFVVNQ